MAQPRECYSVVTEIWAYTAEHGQSFELSDVTEVDAMCESSGFDITSLKEHTYFLYTDGTMDTIIKEVPLHD